MKLSYIGGVMAVGLCALTTVTLRASDFVGVYTVVQKIVLEPGDTAPQRVQIWGAVSPRSEEHTSELQSL